MLFEICAADQDNGTLIAFTEDEKN